jgi:hypothetical protein
LAILWNRVRQTDVKSTSPTLSLNTRSIHLCMLRSFTALLGPNHHIWKTSVLSYKVTWTNFQFQTPVDFRFLCRNLIYSLTAHLKH